MKDFSGAVPAARYFVPKKPGFMQKRHKYVLMGLAVYWPAIFIATHIPAINLPGWVARSGLSDKTLHFTAYLCLVFFVWTAISPFDRVNWKRLKAWLVVGLVAGYAVFDELLQMFVGRHADVMDFAANMAGTLVSLAIFTACYFWAGLLWVTGIVIFIITNLSRTYIVMSSELINIAFHFCAYAFFALVWVHQSQKYISVEQGWRWLVWAFTVPVLFLGMVKGVSVYSGEHVWFWDVFTSITGISLSVICSWVTFLPGRELRKIASEKSI